MNAAADQPDGWRCLSCPSFGQRCLILGLAVWISGCQSEPKQTLAPLTSEPPSASLAQPTTAFKHRWTSVEHYTYELPTSVVQVVVVPPEGGQSLTIALADTLETLPNLAQERAAIAAINAGFFDPQNGLTTSFVTVAGAIAADPRQNSRLMTNPDLQAYLPAILDRSEFRIYRCGDSQRYDITTHAAPVPSDCLLEQAVGAGPQLLPTLTGDEEAFWADDATGVRVRDALGSQAPNARSAIGLKADGTVVLAIATQLPGATPPTGLTLPELADFLDQQGVQKALNLDGGSSTGLYIEGKTYFGRFDAAGQPMERPIKSILLVQ